jgi:hypothetical protein
MHQLHFDMFAYLIAFLLFILCTALSLPVNTLRCFVLLAFLRGEYRAARARQ